MGNEPRRLIGGKGPDVHASELRVPSKKSSESQPVLADAISLFAPWAGPEDRPLRLRLNRAQAAATARATRMVHGRSRVLLWLAADIAGEATFARVGADELREAINSLARLFLVAGWIERGAPDADR